ncbi:MAG: PA4780 family RIO1-like protein kinase [Pseudomonadota bacterium]
MRTPERLLPLIEQGIIEEVLMPLQAGKEAEVFLVRSGGETRVAKVYKELGSRGFRSRADYLDGRQVRSSRSQRAIDKRSAFGRREEEDAWHNAEVDALYRIRGLGVRVPEPFHFVDGVLVMELVCDEEGRPAPRLADRTLQRAEAQEVFHRLLREVVKMLCGGLIHADLSDFNVLMGRDGPVLIDFPQAVDPAVNNNARRMLIRDVNNLTRILGRYAPQLRRMRYGEEMWALYEQGELTPDTPLTGTYRGSSVQADTEALLAEIADIEREARERREALGLPPARPPRAPRFNLEPPPDPPKSAAKPAAVEPAAEPPAKKKRRRKKRRPESAEAGGGPAQAAPKPAPKPPRAAAPTARSLPRPGSAPQVPPWAPPRWPAPGPGGQGRLRPRCSHRRRGRW